MRGGKIFERGADRFEQGDLVRAAAARLLAARQFVQIGDDGIGAQDAGGQRLNDVAGFLGRAGAGVDIDAGAADRFVVGLAHGRRKAADQIDMHARFQQRPLDQRLGRDGRRGDDVGLAKRRIEVARRRCVETILAQRGGGLLGIFLRAVPDTDIADRTNRRMRLGEERAKRPCPDDQQLRSIVAREIAGGERRGAGGAPLGQALAVDQGARFAGAPSSSR